MALFLKSDFCSLQKVVLLRRSNRLASLDGDVMCFVLLLLKLGAN